MPVGKHYGRRVGHFGLLRVGAELSFLHYCENRSNPSFKADAVERCMFPVVYSARRLTQTLGVTEVLRCEQVHPKNSQHGFVPRGVCVASITAKNSGPASSASPSERGHAIRHYQFRVAVTFREACRTWASGEGRERFASYFLPPKIRASFASFGSCFWKGRVSGMSRSGKQ